MQKAYCKYSTISSSVKAGEEENKVARWPSLVHKVATEHGKMISEMSAGKFYDNIEQDPRDSTTNDEKLDLKSIPGFKSLSSQKTMISDEKAHVRPVKLGAHKYIEKMKVLARAARLRVAEKKKAAAAVVIDALIEPETAAEAKTVVEEKVEAVAEVVAVPATETVAEVVAAPVAETATAEVVAAPVTETAAAEVVATPVAEVEPVAAAEVVVAPVTETAAVETKPVVEE